MKLTVYYDDQYWVGVVEEIINGRLKVCKHIFGPEPSDGEILEFINTELVSLLAQASEQISIEPRPEIKRINPKRLARIAAKELKNKGVSTLAQEALRLEREKFKKEKKISSKQKKEEFLTRKRELKIKKAKEKHRGR